MAAPVGLLILAAAGALALSSSGRRRSTGQAQCGAGAPAAARFVLASALSWVDCTGRTADEVAQLAALLERAGRSDDARSVRERWNARRDVELADPDGRYATPEGEAASEAERTPEEPATRRPRGRVTLPGASDIERIEERELAPSGPSAYNPARARELARLVDRSLRSGGGYRSVLRQFQGAAGMEVDGLYGPRSRAALRYYGVANPPAALVARSSPEVYSPPSIRTETVRLSDGEAT